MDLYYNFESRTPEFFQIELTVFALWLIVTEDKIIYMGNGRVFVKGPLERPPTSGHPNGLLAFTLSFPTQVDRAFQKTRN